jgi:hypothetical protein
MDDLRRQVFDLWDEAEAHPDKDTIFRILVRAHGAIQQNDHFRALHLINWAKRLIHGHGDATYE